MGSGFVESKRQELILKKGLSGYDMSQPMLGLACEVIVTHSYPHIRRLDYQGKSLGEIPPEPNKTYYVLDPNVRFLWMLSRFISWLFTYLALTAGFVVLHFAGSKWADLVFYVMLGFLLPACISIFFPLISYKFWGVALRSNDLVVRWGVITKRVMCIPFARIQHVDTHAGPLERAFGVANLAVFTAGSQLGAVAIPGLPSDLAEPLKDFLSKVGHTHANL